MLNARQIAEWEAFYTLEMFGDIREDLRFARLCALLAEINRNHKKRSEPFREEEFMKDGD